MKLINTKMIQYHNGVRDYGLSDEDKLRLGDDTEETRKLSNLIRRLNQYNLTMEQFNELLEKQDSRCAICGKYDKLVIDHDHKCCPARRSCGNCVRGLICHRCNRLLGILEGEPGLADWISEYLS